MTLLKLRFLLTISLAATFLPCTLSAAPWAIKDVANPDGPGRRIEVREGNTLRAALIHGEGQMKPFLNVYGEHDERLTNPGLDAKGKTTGRFPHHRGIFIGWVIKSDIGRYDLWHMNNGGSIKVTGIDLAKGESDKAILRVKTEWHGKPQGDKSKSIIINETRTLTFTRPKAKTTQVDARFSLNAARDLSLDGDLQHSGIHFRADNEVATREKETSYLKNPQHVKGNDLKWVRLLYPIGKHWYTTQEMNSPHNPVEELSTRNYGRFGYFFKKKIAKGETLDLDYRFMISEVDAPANAPKQSPAQQEQSRKECEQNYQQFVKSLTK